MYFSNGGKEYKTSKSLKELVPICLLLHPQNGGVLIWHVAGGGVKNKGLLTGLG